MEQTNTSSKNWLKHDLVTLGVINALFLAGLIILFYLNKSDGAVEKTIIRMFGIH